MAFDSSNTTVRNKGLDFVGLTDFSFKMLVQMNKHLGASKFIGDPFDRFYKGSTLPEDQRGKSEFRAWLLRNTVATERQAAWLEALKYLNSRASGPTYKPGKPQAKVTPVGLDPVNDPFNDPPPAPVSVATEPGPTAPQVDVPTIEGIARRIAEACDRDLSATLVDRMHGMECDLQAAIQAACTPRTIVFSGLRPEPLTVSGAMHPMAPKVLALLQQGLNVMLIGPAGAGKTHMSDALAEMLGVPYGSLSYTSGVSETALLGRSVPNLQTGASVWTPSEFCTLYEQEASLFAHDEFDAADPNLAIVLNAATANGSFYNPMAGRRFKRGKRAMMLALCNTYGTGADAQFVGRNAQDAAVLDRWYPVEISYDEAYEASLCGVTPINRTPLWAPTAPRPDDAAKLHTWVTGIRQSIRSRGLLRSAGTRWLQKGMAALAAGVPFAEVQSDLLIGWTRDERTMVGGGN